MRYMPWFLAAAVAAAPCAHAESISVPWEEFKALYRRSIEEEMMRELPKEARTAVHAVEDASYQISIHGTGQGETSSSPAGFCLVSRRRYRFSGAGW